MSSTSAVPPSVIYEVNVDVHPSIAAEYREWLVGHVSRMRQVLHGMQRADICQRIDAVPPPSDWVEGSDDGGEGESKPAPWVGFTVSYLVESAAHLEDYVANRSAVMRQEAIDRFGTKHFRATRRVMEVVSLITTA